jgi:hypothetical protein
VQLHNLFISLIADVGCDRWCSVITTAAGQKKQLDAADDAFLQFHHLLVFSQRTFCCNCWCSVFKIAAGQKKKLDAADDAFLQLHCLFILCALVYSEFDCNCWCSLITNCSWPEEEAGCSRRCVPATAPSVRSVCTIQSEFGCNCWCSLDYCAAGQKKKLDAADDAFLQSDTLKALLTYLQLLLLLRFQTAAGQKKKLDAADDAFLQSDTLKALLTCLQPLVLCVQLLQLARRRSWMQQTTPCCKCTICSFYPMLTRLPLFDCHCWCTTTDCSWPEEEAGCSRRCLPAERHAQGAAAEERG